MNQANSFILKVKRGDSRVYRALRRIARLLLSPSAPRIPSALRSPLRWLYEFHWGVIVVWNFILNLCYRQPLFQARCASFGRGVVIDRLPFVSGHAEIHIGNDCYIGGNLTIMSGRVLDRPMFVMKDRAELGWNVRITVNREVIIEEHARVSFNCQIADSDGHPRQADLRAANQPMAARDIRPVRICKHAWVGNGTHIMKGVTIGEGAVIGANSVVISDVPPYSLALGNPAEVVLHNYGRPTQPKGTRQPEDTPSPKKSDI